MKKKVLLTLCAMLSLSMLVACGKTNKTENETATPNDAIATETDATNTDADSYIPDENSDFIYADSSMTEIIGLNDPAFHTFDLIFPENVNKISNVILSTSEVRNIYFMNPDVVLENVSFSGSLIEYVNIIPTTMTEIPDNLFLGCAHLTTIGNTDRVITIPDYVTSIGSSAFSGCSRITSIDVSHLTSIGDQAFENCMSLVNVVWNKKLESIGYASFINCGFTEIKLPSSVKTIGSCAFARNNNLTVVDYPKNATVADDAFDLCDKLNNNEPSHTDNNEEHPSTVEVNLDGSIDDSQAESASDEN